MDTKMHPLVELMLARMKSHPEEFEGSDGDVYAYNNPPAGERWRCILLQMKGHTTPEEEAALWEALRVIRMGALHREAMDELCNGEERRRKAEEDRVRWEQQSMMAKQQMSNSAINQLNSSYQNTLSGLATAKGVNQVQPSLLGSIKKGLGI